MLSLPTASLTSTTEEIISNTGGECDVMVLRLSLKPTLLVLKVFSYICLFHFE